MVKIMSIIILFNYILDGNVSKEVMQLLYKEFDEHINVHVKSNYFDRTNRRKLGGRAAGQ